MKRDEGQFVSGGFTPRGGRCWRVPALAVPAGGRLACQESIEREIAVRRLVGGMIAAVALALAVSCGRGTESRSTGGANAAGVANPTLPPAPTMTVQEQVGRYSFAVTAAIDTFARSNEEIGQLVKQPLPDDSGWRGRLRSQVDRRKNAWADIRKQEAPACLAEMHATLLRAADLDGESLTLLTAALGPVDAKTTDLDKLNQSTVAAQRVAALIGEAAQQAQGADCKLGG